jgi:hypothetical protein
MCLQEEGREADREGRVERLRVVYQRFVTELEVTFEKAIRRQVLHIYQQVAGGLRIKTFLPKIVDL